jgi:hypothetical protein
VNGREAVKALMDGKKVRHIRWNDHDDHVRWVNGRDSHMGWLECSIKHSTPWILETIADHPGPFEIYESPISDEQLVAEWERVAEFIRTTCVIEKDAATWAGAYEKCARQLRERKL